MQTGGGGEVTMATFSLRVFIQSKIACIPLGIWFQLAEILHIYLKMLPVGFFKLNLRLVLTDQTVLQVYQCRWRGELLSHQKSHAWTLSWPSPGRSVAVAVAVSAGQTGGNGLVVYLSCTEYLKQHGMLVNCRDSTSYIVNF